MRKGPIGSDTHSRRSDRPADFGKIASATSASANILSDDALRLVPWLILFVILVAASWMIATSLREQLAKRRAALRRDDHGTGG